MKLTKSSIYIDGYYYCCRSKYPILDIKQNLRTNSIYENIKIPINILYFLTFYTFLDVKSISKPVIETKSFCSDIESSNPISPSTVIKLYQILRDKMKNKMLSNWLKNPLENDISSNEYMVVEIDKSKIIGNNQKILWMFGIIERFTKEARVFTVMTKRTAYNLLNIVKKNVVTTDLENDEDIENENQSTKTRIYSNSFASYKVNKLYYAYITL